MNKYDGVVGLGALLLDQKKPGWRKGIDKVLLHLKHPSTCMLGQLYGSFAQALEELGLEDGSEARTHGFDLLTTSSQDWILLGEAWITVVEKRKEEVFEQELFEPTKQSPEQTLSSKELSFLVGDQQGEFTGENSGWFFLEEPDWGVSPIKMQQEEQYELV